jgi:peptide/nickel transport system permease protein
LTVAAATFSAEPVAATRRPSLVRQALRNPAVIAGGLILVVCVLAGVLAPWLGTVDPQFIDVTKRLKTPSDAFLLGTDHFGRDIYSRVLYGARVSLFIGFAVALLSIVIGTAIGLVSGYIRALDTVVMRLMDGLMAIPGILLAIALIAVSGASLTTVIIAITIPDIPRIVRLVRGVVLSLREEPYVEAAISLGTPVWRILLFHILPNTIAPLIVQGTFIAASAILVEAGLSFLGAGVPPEIPTWGNVMAEGRTYFRLAPWIILFPGIALSITVLAVNIMGDGLRDTLDPRLAKRV